MLAVLTRKQEWKKLMDELKKKSRTPFKTYCRYTLALSRSMATGGTSTKQTSATLCPQALVALTWECLPLQLCCFIFRGILCGCQGTSSTLRLDHILVSKTRRHHQSFTFLFLIQLPALLLSSHRQHNCRNSFFVFTSSSDWFV